MTAQTALAQRRAVKTTKCGQKAELRRDSIHFPLIAVTGYRSHVMRRVEIIRYLYSSDTQYSVTYFTVKTKAYNVIISYIVQLRLLFKSVISFCLNYIVEQYSIIGNLGRFMSHPVYDFYYIHSPMEGQKKPNDFCCFRCVIEQWALIVIQLVMFFVLIWVRGNSRLLEMALFDRSSYEFLFAFQSNYAPILSHF